MSLSSDLENASSASAIRGIGGIEPPDDAPLTAMARIWSLALSNTGLGADWRDLSLPSAVLKRVRTEPSAFVTAETTSTTLLCGGRAASADDGREGLSLFPSVNAFVEEGTGPGQDAGDAQGAVDGLGVRGVVDAPSRPRTAQHHAPANAKASASNAPQRHRTTAVRRAVPGDRPRRARESPPPTVPSDPFHDMA